MSPPPPDSTPNPFLISGPNLTENAIVGPSAQSIECATLDNKDIRDKAVRLSLLKNIGFKKAKLQDCKIQHSFIENCYFRETEFTNVSLVGSRFTNCNFDKASFSDCSLDYAEFFNCSITYEQVQSCLDRLNEKPNVLRDLARSLRLNAQQRGQMDDSRKFLMAELKASATHCWLKASAWNHSFYGKKYRLEDRISGGFKWLMLKIEDVIWGYGEMPTRVFRAAGIVIVIFMLMFNFGIIRVINMPDPNMFDYLGISAATFAGAPYGIVLPADRSARLLMTVETYLGLISFGLLVATFYRRISKR